MLDILGKYKTKELEFGFRFNQILAHFFDFELFKLHQFYILFFLGAARWQHKLLILQLI